MEGRECSDHLLMGPLAALLVLADALGNSEGELDVLVLAGSALSVKNLLGKIPFSLAVVTGLHFSRFCGSLLKHVSNLLSRKALAV